MHFRGHFHGWHDHVSSGYSNHFDGSPTTRRAAPGVADNVLMADPNDVAGIDRLFSDHKDIAAVILEPTGASFGKMPILTSFLAHLRDLTRQAGTMLIFDEVVTGFRVSPGGAAEGGRDHAGHDDAGENPVGRACRAARWSAARTSSICSTSM